MRHFLPVFILLSLRVLQASVAFGEAEAIFSPKRSLKENLLKEVEATASTLDLAVRKITSPDMANALLKAKGWGFTVRVITDSIQAKMKSSKVTSLIQEGIRVKVFLGKDYGVMNDHLAILDSKKVVTGSFDWSDASEKWNLENIVIIGESEVAAPYQKEFDRLWREKR